MSHGAFHKSLKVLQDELGFELYSVQGRSVAITKEGRDFYTRALKFLDEERNLLSNNLSENPTFRIVSHETLIDFLISPNWHRNFGMTPLICKVQKPGSLEAAVAEGEVDVGLTHIFSPRSDLESIKLGQTRMGIFARHDFESKKPLSEWPFVAPVNPKDFIATSMIGLDSWPEGGVQRNIVYRSESLLSALNFVADGLCAIFIPQFVAHTYNSQRPAKFHITELPAPKGIKDIKRDVFLLLRPGQKETPMIKKFARYVSKHAFEKFEAL